MIGIVIVTHCQLGLELMNTVAFILDEKPESLIPISIDIRDNAEKLRKKISKAIKQVNQHKGVLILTDMFGGTPSNLSYSFLEEGKIEVLSGVNLPILLKALDARKKNELSALAKLLEESGKRSISLASAILKGNKPNG